MLDLRVDDKLFSVKNARDAKALAVTYAAGKHAMLKARVPPTSAIVGCGEAVRVTIKGLFKGFKPQT